MVSVWIICGYILWEDWKERDQALPVTVHEEETEEKLEQIAVNIATIGMIGDVLLHYPINTYPSYDFAFQEVKEKMMGIDFLIANQESMPGVLSWVCPPIRSSTAQNISFKIFKAQALI